MRKGVANGRLYGPVLLLSVVGVASLRAQDPRDACLAQALNEFDPARRQQQLMCALNPSAGPPRGGWPVSVQLLAQTLIEEGRDSAAAAWLRWAIRLSPDLQPDTVRFLPRVVAAYRAARDFVSRTRVPGDSAVSATWLWPAPGTADTVGRIQVTALAAVPLRVEVTGVGPIGVGGSIPVSPGSYQITATASGYDSVRVTREVVPGVTTVVEFHPPSALARVAPKPVPPAAKPAPAAGAQKKGGFPVALAVLGAGGAAALVAILAGRKGSSPPSGPSTGSITIFFPNP